MEINLDIFGMLIENCIVSNNDIILITYQKIYIILIIIISP